MAAAGLHAVVAALFTKIAVRSHRPGQGLVFGCGVGGLGRLRSLIGEDRLLGGGRGGRRARAGLDGAGLRRTAAVPGLSC